MSIVQAENVWKNEEIILAFFELHVVLLAVAKWQILSNFK